MRTGIPPQESERLDTEAEAEASAAAGRGQQNSADDHQRQGPQCGLQRGPCGSHSVRKGPCSWCLGLKSATTAKQGTALPALSQSLQHSHRQPNPELIRDGYSYSCFSQGGFYIESAATQTSMHTYAPTYLPTSPPTSIHGEITPYIFYIHTETHACRHTRSMRIYLPNVQPSAVRASRGIRRATPYVDTVGGAALQPETVEALFKAAAGGWDPTVRFVYLDLQNGPNDGPYILPILSLLGYWAILLGSFGGPGRPPNVPVLRVFWSLLDGAWGALRGSWLVLALRKTNM